MKKTLLFALCISALSSFAKDGFFFQPTVGAGGGCAILKPKAKDKKPTFLHSETLVLGYQKSHWVIISGLGYTQSGLGFEFNYTDINNNPIGRGNARVHFRHITLPLMAGYRKGLTQKFSIYPLVGAEISRNLSLRSVITGPYPGTETMKGDIFKLNYRPMSVFVAAQLNMEFLVSKKVNIVCAPKIDYMVTNIEKEPYHKLNNYIIGATFGLKINL